MGELIGIHGLAPTERTRRDDYYDADVPQYVQHRRTVDVYQPERAIPAAVTQDEELVEWNQKPPRRVYIDPQVVEHDKADSVDYYTAIEEPYTTSEEMPLNRSERKNLRREQMRAYKEERTLLQRTSIYMAKLGIAWFSLGFAFTGATTIEHWMGGTDNMKYVATSSVSHDAAAVSTGVIGGYLEVKHEVVDPILSFGSATGHVGNEIFSNTIGRL